MIKHLFIGFVALITLTGCHHETEPQPTPATTTSQPKVKETGVKRTTPEKFSAENFFFETNETGLFLKTQDDEAFSQQLSIFPIQTAEITNNVLTFVEIVGDTTQTKSFNLDEITAQLNNTN